MNEEIQRGCIVWPLIVDTNERAHTYLEHAEQSKDWWEAYLEDEIEERFGDPVPGPADATDLLVRGGGQICWTLGVLTGGQCD